MPPANQPAEVWRAGWGLSATDEFELLTHGLEASRSAWAGGSMLSNTRGWEPDVVAAVTPRGPRRAHQEFILGDTMHRVDRRGEGRHHHQAPAKPPPSGSSALAWAEVEEVPFDRVRAQPAAAVHVSREGCCCGCDTSGSV